MADDWSYPLALNWRLQLRYLWNLAADAFEIVAAVLPKRASSAALAEVRLLVETYCQARWLTEAAEERQRRACSIAMAEIRDLRGIFNAWATQRVERDEMLAMLVKMESEANQRAQRAEGAVRRPRLPQLLQGYGYGSVAYATLSDVGSHPGIASSLIFFHTPGTDSIDLNPARGLIERAYFLGMAYEAYGRTAEVIAQARGREMLSVKIRRHIDSHGGMLRGITGLVEEQAGHRDEGD